MITVIIVSTIITLIEFLIVKYFCLLRYFNDIRHGGYTYTKEEPVPIPVYTIIIAFLVNLIPVVNIIIFFGAFIILTIFTAVFRKSTISSEGGSVLVFKGGIGDFLTKNMGK